MRRRRMRKSKRNNDKYGAATVVLLVLLVAAFIYAFQSLGIYDILFRPTFHDGTSAPGFSENPTVSADVSGSPGASVSGSPAPSGTKISDEIKMNSVTLYGVQLGVFTKLDNAETTSEKFKKEGSAGYLLKEETLYRIVDSVYYAEGDAKAVRDKYRQGSSPDACILRVEASGINWKVNATREQIDAIRGAVTALQKEVVALINVQKQAAVLGQGSLTDYKAAAKASAQNLTSANDTLKKAVGSTSTSVINNLIDCLADGAENLNKLADDSIADTAAFNSGLKYNIIDLLLRLQKDIMEAK